MNKMKKIYTLLIAAILIFATMALTACGGNGPYKVTVKDSAGNPCGGGVVVLFMQNGAQVGMQVCDENGVATKELEPGEYTVQLQFTNAETSYYYEEVKVTAKNREVEIILMGGVSESEVTTLITGEDSYDAYHVKEGTTYVPLETEGRNYFIFTPDRPGIYEFYVEDDAPITIGYYGMPHYIQENSIEEVIDGVIRVSITKGMIGDGETGTSRLVLGLDVTDGKTTDGKLTIRRVGDPEWTVEDEEWIVLEPTVDLEVFEVPEGTTFGEFDVTADGYDIVFNEEDGYYHLNSADGPLVVVYLAEDPPIPYVPCFLTILEETGVSRYFFDEDGEFIKKEEYTKCLNEYIAVADEVYGVYPLTEDLYYILHQKTGWWDKESPDFIFKEMDGTPIVGLNTEIAWLFMCGYIQ